MAALASDQLPLEFGNASKSFRPGDKAMIRRLVRMPLDPDILPNWISLGSFKLVKSLYVNNSITTPMIGLMGCAIGNQFTLSPGYGSICALPPLKVNFSFYWDFDSYRASSSYRPYPRPHYSCKKSTSTQSVLVNSRKR
jgi:hypothetical protein